MADAHSFFLAALDQIHAHAKGQLSSCNCIARVLVRAWQAIADSLTHRPDFCWITLVFGDMFELSHAVHYD